MPTVQTRADVRRVKTTRSDQCHCPCARKVEHQTEGDQTEGRYESAPSPTGCEDQCRGDTHQLESVGISWRPNTGSRPNDRSPVQYRREHLEEAPREAGQTDLDLNVVA